MNVSLYVIFTNWCIRDYCSSSFLSRSVKSIRNNWLNQHDYNRTFLYSSFDDFSHKSKALFEDIRQLYRSEQNSVAKLAHRLTAKLCWPSSLQRQNVSSAHRVFNESTAAALRIQNSSRLKFNFDAADFVTIISNVWKISTRLVPRHLLVFVILAWFYQKL